MKVSFSPCAGVQVGVMHVPYGRSVVALSNIRAVSCGARPQQFMVKVHRTIVGTAAAIVTHSADSAQTSEG